MNLDEDAENEFVAEQVQEIITAAVQQTLADVTYASDKVPLWCSLISDGCLKELTKLNKPFKYAVTCIIMQKTGAPLHTAATAFWNTKTDGLCSLQVGSDTMDCIVTVFAMQI
eukprot:GHVT01061435.1.p2 GENE.GHVT01061435.1~~GHVT01061435.1.p2  ORF type:complete len:113 (+),score=18.48 GHVT01061435.1:257-595(+)